MSKVKLLPCPFCGAEPKRYGHTYQGKLIGTEYLWPTYVVPRYEQLHWYIVKCPKCKISQPKKVYSTREESDAAWNQRL